MNVKKGGLQLAGLNKSCVPASTVMRYECDKSGEALPTVYITIFDVLLLSITLSNQKQLETIIGNVHRFRHETQQQNGAHVQNISVDTEPSVSTHVSACY